MKRIVLCALIALLAAGGIVLHHRTESSRIAAEHTALLDEILALQQAAIEAADLARKVPAPVDVTAFTEALYGCARDVGIHDHEVVTSQHQDGQIMRGKRRKQATQLETYRIRVALSGGFRQIASYIDQAQALAGHKRIALLSLVPGAGELDATLTIDLYQPGGQDER